MAILPVTRASLSAKRLLVLAAVALCTLVTACAPKTTQRLLVTVSVEDNGTVYIGSAVQEVACWQAIKAFGSLDSAACGFDAEAIPVKIGDKGWVFMILSRHECCRSDWYITAITSGRSKENMNLPWRVPPDQAPPFVRFTDLNDRSTVYLVEPGDFGRVIGQGVALRSVQVEPSRERLTKGKIQTLLPWLKELSYHYFDETIPNNANNILTQISGSNFQ